LGSAYIRIIRTLVYAKESTIQTAEKYTTNSRKVHYKQQKSTLQTAEKYTTNSRKVHYKLQKSTLQTAEKYTTNSRKEVLRLYLLILSVLWIVTDKLYMCVNNINRRPIIMCVYVYCTLNPKYKYVSLQLFYIILYTG